MSVAAEPIVSPEATEAAERAGLRYVSDLEPGIRRIRHGKGFRYVGPDGRTVTDRETLRRIRSIVIPPAWTEVWICTSERGHIQAVGRMRSGASNIAITPTGAPCAMKRSSSS
jgi:DNA topoisomerase-1